MQSKVKPWDNEMLLAANDFRPYSEKGFLFDYGQYCNGQYDVLAEILIEALPGAQKISCLDWNNDKKYNEWTKQGYSLLTTSPVCCIYKPVVTSELIKKCYDVCKDFGADAIINFEIKVENKSNGGIMFPVYYASGIAIKRIQ